MKDFRSPKNQSKQSSDLNFKAISDSLHKRIGSLSKVQPRHNQQPFKSTLEIIKPRDNDSLIFDTSSHNLLGGMNGSITQANFGFGYKSKHEDDIADVRVGIEGLTKFQTESRLKQIINTLDSYKNHKPLIKKRVSSQLNLHNSRKEEQQEFNDLEFYKQLLKRYGEDLRQVFLGFDANINLKSIGKDISNSKSNRHFYLIRNLKYIIKKGKFNNHNTDLDDFEDPFQSDQLGQLHKQLGFKEEKKDDEEANKMPRGAIIPKQFKSMLKRSNSIISLFKNEDLLSVNTNNSKKNAFLQQEKDDQEDRISVGKKLIQQQKLEMIYFDKDLNPTKHRPQEESNWMDDSHDPTQRSSNEYTLKDLTQKGADIKKIFAEICPEKFNKKKKLIDRYSKNSNNLNSKNLTQSHLQQMLDSTEINTNSLLQRSKTLIALDGTINQNISSVLQQTTNSKIQKEKIDNLNDLFNNNNSNINLQDNQHILPLKKSSTLKQLPQLIYNGNISSSNQIKENNKQRIVDDDGEVMIQLRRSNTKFLDNIGNLKQQKNTKQQHKQLIKGQMNNSQQIMMTSSVNQNHINLNNFQHCKMINSGNQSKDSINSPFTEKYILNYKINNHKKHGAPHDTPQNIIMIGDQEVRVQAELDHELMVRKREQSLAELQHKVRDFKLPDEVIPQRPEVTQDDNALSILYKFQEMHKFNMFHAKRKLANINAFHQQEAEDADYQNFYDKNKETVSKQIDEVKQKYQVKFSKSKSQDEDTIQQALGDKQKISNDSKDPNHKYNEDYLNAMYDQSGRLIIQNHDHANHIIQSFLQQQAILKEQQQQLMNSKNKKKSSDSGVQELSFSKVGKQIFQTKTKPYHSLIQDKTSEEYLRSFKKVLKNLKHDSDLQYDQKLKQRDEELKAQEKLVGEQMNGMPLFQDLSIIDEIDENNKYFLQQFHKITKDPLHKINYKLELAKMDAKRVRENARRESEELVEMEKRKIAEKRDIFMSKEHDTKRRKRIVHAQQQQKYQN
eukprot:403373144